MTEPRIGVASWVIHHRRLLVGRRVGSHGKGTWSPPGGHPDWTVDTQLVDTARRETLEECDLRIFSPRLFAETFDEFEDDRKYITLHYWSYCIGSHTIVKEPDKMVDWKWVTFGQLLRLPLFLPAQNLLTVSAYDEIRMHVE